MADWFKFHENDLDEMRLQYAIGELPEVLNVWIVLLSEACRHKDGTLCGYNQDFELFGISKRINVSVPLVNKAISLLLKINYLERAEDKSLIIRKWTERQSEYCQKKSRLQNQSGSKHHTKKNLHKQVPIVSGQTPDSVRQEERRGEEIYKENSQVLIRYLNSKAGTQFRETADGNLKFVSARLKDGASVEDCKLVIDAKCKEWIGGEFAKYLRPETIFNASKFDSYLGVAKAMPVKKAYIPETTEHLREAERQAAIARYEKETGKTYIPKEAAI